jgi:hypothetical protein
VLVVKRALCRCHPRPAAANTPTHPRQMLFSRIVFGDLEGMPVLLPLDAFSPAPDASSSLVLDVFRQARGPYITAKAQIIRRFPNSRTAAMRV